jgi:hypothetical protein
MQETDDDIIFVFGGDDPMVKLLLHAYLGRSVKLQIESFVYVQASKEQFRGRVLGIAMGFLRFIHTDFDHRFHGKIERNHYRIRKVN